MRFWVLVPALAVAACSSPGIVDTGRVKVVEADALPTPTLADFESGRRPQVVGPFDTINVEVYGVPDLTRDVVINANGQFVYPIVGLVEATGKTPQELSAFITARLQGTVRDPQVIVSVRQVLSQTVTVDGEVRKPGVFPVQGRMTMLRAIASAEGTSDYANTSHVVVLRTVNNERMAALYDLRAIRVGAYADPEVYPNDVIVVGEASTRRIVPTILQSTGALLAPLIYLLR